MVDQLKEESENPLESEFIMTDADPDLPETAKFGGMITTCVGQFVPGQLVLAIAEQIIELGGHILTSCTVEQIVEEDGKLKVISSLEGKEFIQIARNVAHCWNGYGPKDKFLPERLSKQINPRRT